MANYILFFTLVFDVFFSFAIITNVEIIRIVVLILIGTFFEAFRVIFETPLEISFEMMFYSIDRMVRVVFQASFIIF